MYRYICYLLSIDGSIDYDQPLDFSVFEHNLRSMSNDQAWLEAQLAHINHCRGMALASLTPKQLAAYIYMCNRFSAYADCDRLQADRGDLDLVALQRREHYVVHGVEMVIGAMDASIAWDQCSQNVSLKQHHHQHDHTVAEAVEHYGDMLSAAACLLNELFEENGLLNNARLFEQLRPAMAYLGLQDLENHCGPSVGGYKHVSAEKLIQCIVTEGMLLVAAQDSNAAAASVPESCIM